MQTQLQSVRGFLVAMILVGTFIVSATFAFADTGTTTGYSYDDQSYHSGYGTSTSSGYGSSTRMYRAFLSPNQEVPPVNSTTTGNIAVHTNGNSLGYTLNVFNGNDITAAHLHCGSTGENGPVVVGLFHAGSATSSSVDVHGNLASGTVHGNNIATTSADCVNVIGYQVQSVSDVRRALQNEDIYANVHSIQHPAGTTRGQLIASSGGQGGSGSGSGGHSTSTDDGYGHGHWDDHDKDYHHKDKKWDDDKSSDHDDDDWDSGKYWHDRHSDDSDNSKDWDSDDDSWKHSSNDSGDDCDDDSDHNRWNKWDN